MNGNKGNREQTITRVTIWGALVNLVLTVLKFIAGVLGNSAAMMADAVHSLSDLVSDVIVIIMVGISAKQQDKGHDYGHGKFETLASAAVALLLVVAGARLMAGGVREIRDVAAGHELERPSLIALIAALVSIAVKEVLYQWTARTGRKVNSPVMISNAWHHRTDALSSVGAALGIGGAILLGGKWALLDPLVCCLISVFIIYVAVRMAIPALEELTDASLPEEVEDRMKNIILSIKGVRDVHDIRTRSNGSRYIMDAHIVVDPDMKVSEAHRITDLAESEIRNEYGDETYISLHVEPSVESD